MLQIKDISKEYRTGPLVQKALNHVSLNLRDNEFVAILGPSGSGKTTLLNIIGGLDRYDSGDLIINGVSTKKYRDRDWDSYRNHTIGFVFQSYNLIPHQTVLANVELALTIGGISRAERRNRAMEALRKVGLAEQMHKRPSQMSGGQMQRVAIARALVNDPDILLADEPTGALDSETSIQVMDLLREVARDRLVVMVTHNPELAEQYATRIVRVKDGVIRDDTDPYVVDLEEEPIHRNFGKSSMSFLTALGLSFNNLKTKLARTLLIALAGSIGITGIALILSLSTGVNLYIKNIEEETLSEYPLEITSSSFDLGSFMGVQLESMKSDAEVVEWKTISNMLTKITANDLSSLKTYFDSGDSGIEEYSRAVEYQYSLSPEIYRMENSNVYQVNPDSTFSDMGFSGMSMYSPSYSTNSFMCLPKHQELYLDQYEVKAGRWPENNNELVVVLSQNGRIADLTLYALGMKDHAELELLVKQYMNGEAAKLDDSVGEYRYTDFLGLSFRLVHSCDYYQYDSEYNVWTKKSEDKRFLRKLVEAGEELTVVGVVMPKEDSSVAMLTTGVYYLPGLIEEITEYDAASDIVQAQLANPERDIISDTPFGEETDGSFDLKDLFSVDEDALANAIQFDASFMDNGFAGMDFSNIDLSSLDFSGVQLPDVDIQELFGKVEITLETGDVVKLFMDLLKDYSKEASGDPTSDLSKLPAAFSEYLATQEARQILEQGVSDILAAAAKQSITQSDLQQAVQAVVDGYAEYASNHGIFDNSGFSDFLSSEAGQALLIEQAEILAGKMAGAEIPEEMILDLQKKLMDGYASYAANNQLPDVEKSLQAFSQWLSSEYVRNTVTAVIRENIKTDGLEEELNKIMDQMTAQMEKAMASVMNQVVEQISYSITDSMANMAGSLEDALKIDGDAFAKAFKVTMTEEELQQLMTAMMSQAVTSLDSNLSKMGYVDLKKPSSITIYPRNFESKGFIKDILNDYNKQKEDSGQEEKVVSYTDIVGTLMSSVTDIINAISYVLVAFVAISLVVSSIMIGVITYISVLERKKEIGILRAIGASKNNISQVFNAETFIIGLLAGLIGIGVTELILIPGNMLIHYLTDMNDISAVLDPRAAVVLIMLSVVLTLLGGLLPAKKAAKSDPVTALRSE